MKTFPQKWAEKEAEGYQYGEDALEQVRFGYELAQEEADRDCEALTAIIEVQRAEIKRLQNDLVANGLILESANKLLKRASLDMRNPDLLRDISSHLSVGKNTEVARLIVAACAMADATEADGNVEETERKFFEQLNAYRLKFLRYV